MIQSFRRTIAALSLLALVGSSTGCFGRFVLVKKVYGFNESLSSNKFVRTLIFWVFVFFPIYEFAALADAVVLNLIEFWTGSNPLAMADGESQQRIVEADGQKATITYSDHGRSVRIEIAQAGREPRVFQFHGDETGAQLTDGSGNVLASGRLTAGGSSEVRDGSGALLSRHDQAEMDALSGSLEVSPAALAMALRPRPEALACALP